jgi:hypothetical protein
MQTRYGPLEIGIRWKAMPMAPVLVLPSQLLVKSPQSKPGPSLAYPYSIWYDMNYARLIRKSLMEYLDWFDTYPVSEDGIGKVTRENKFKLILEIN